MLLNFCLIRNIWFLSCAPTFVKNCDKTGFYKSKTITLVKWPHKKCSQKTCLKCFRNKEFMKVNQLWMNDWDTSHQKSQRMESQVWNWKVPTHFPQLVKYNTGKKCFHDWIRTMLKPWKLEKIMTSAFLQESSFLI